jgi:hypothetical protein
VAETSVDIYLILCVYIAVVEYRGICTVVLS